MAEMEGEARGRQKADGEWLLAIINWQEHPKCAVTMADMFYDAKQLCQPFDPYRTETCDGCRQLRALITRALLP